MQGYDLDLVSSELICVAEFEEENKLNIQAYYPSQYMLINNGFEVITEEEPFIYWRDGRKYCQGNILQQIVIEKSAKFGGVYIVEVRNSGLFKIGVTKDINKRLSQLQTSNPYEFYLIDFFKTDKNRELEKFLHNKFRNKRYKREWFKLNQEELSEACKIACDFIKRPFLTDTLTAQKHFKIDDEIIKLQISKGELPF